MYAWNGHTYIAFYNWKEIFECMSVNSPIVVLDKNVGSSASMDDIVKHMLFVINPSSIAIVFPVIQVGQGDEVVEEGEETTEPEISDLVDTYVGSTNKDGITS
jgi:hypothetical protein